MATTRRNGKTSAVPVWATAFSIGTIRDAKSDVLGAPRPSTSSRNRRGASEEPAVPSSDAGSTTQLKGATMGAMRPKPSSSRKASSKPEKAPSGRRPVTVVESAVVHTSLGIGVDRSACNPSGSNSATGASAW